MSIIQVVLCKVKKGQKIGNTFWGYGILNAIKNRFNWKQRTHY